MSHGGRPGPGDGPHDFALPAPALRNGVSHHLLRQAVGGPTARWPVVLMYHAMDPPRRPSGWPWAIPADRFAGHLDLLLAMGIRTLRLDQVEDLGGPGPSVVLTFDDGYADNYEWAVPELTRRGQCATWFIPSARVGGEADWLEGQVPRRPLMDRGQLQGLLAAGMEIGGHGRHHCPLVGLAEGEIQGEVAGCRQDLQALLGVRIDSFAYPYGRYDAAAREAAARAGYRYACTTRPGWWGSEKDRLQLRRVAVLAGDTAATLARKLCFADNDVRWRTLARYYVGRLWARLPGGGP